MNSLTMMCLLVMVLGSPPDKILDRAVKHYEAREYRQAIDLLSSSGNPGEASAERKIWLGKSYLKIREWDRAVEAMKEAVELEPSNAKYRLELGRAYGARAEQSTLPIGDALRTKDEFEKARELDPDDIDVRFDLLEYYIQAPRFGFGGGEKKARAEAEAIAKLNPKLGYTARATIYERKEKWDKAEKEYIRATQAYPKDADVHKDFAQFLFGLDPPKYREAWDSAQKVLELNPESKQGLFIAAACGIFLGRNIDKAGRDLSLLASGSLGEGDPALEDVYYWLGMLHYRKGEREKAREAFGKALEVRPNFEKAEKKLKILR